MKGMKKQDMPNGSKLGVIWYGDSGGRRWTVGSRMRHDQKVPPMQRTRNLTSVCTDEVNVWIICQ